MKERDDFVMAQMEFVDGFFAERNWGDRIGIFPNAIWLIFFEHLLLAGPVASFVRHSTYLCYVLLNKLSFSESR